MILEAWVPVPSTGAFGGACWASQGIALLLGHPVHSAVCCQVWQRLAPGIGKGSGRSWVQAEKLQGRERGLWGQGVAT